MTQQMAELDMVGEADPHEFKCLDILRDTLRAHRGLTHLAWDKVTNRILLSYAPEHISDEAVSRIAEKLNDQFVRRYHDCRLDANRVGCDRCTLSAALRSPETDLSVDYDAHRISVGLLRPPPTVRTHEKPITVDPPPDAVSVWKRRWEQHHLVFWTALAGAFILTGWIAEATGHEIPGHWLYLFGYLSGGWLAAKESFDGLRKYRLDVNLLMTLAAIGAAILGRWAEGATLIFLFSLSNTLEHYALERTRKAVHALMKVRPSEARAIRAGNVVMVAVEELLIGDRVVVKPGEKIPADGAIESGRTTIDASTFTGEALPVERGPRESVLAGTMNLSAEITLAVTRRASDTALAAIIHRVEQAQSGRTPTHSFVRWFGQRYTIGILGGAALVAFLPPLFTQIGWGTMFYKALTLLVVASPCALIISTPAAVLSAIGRAATRGVLFKSGESLVTLGHVRAIAFDKTGTLTQGHAVLTDVAPVNGAGEHDLLAMAAAVETGSTHPLAEAIVGAASERGIVFTRATDATTHPGRGASGVTVEGERVLVGNRVFLIEQGVPVDSAADLLLAQFESAGKTAVLVGTNRVLGVLALADPIRREAAASIQSLRKSGIESVCMLTGDHERAAAAIAAPLGIDTVRAQLMPGDKADAVEQLLRRHKAVAIVGDGINDAPALASASVGVAMGGAGNDVVLESADVVLMADDLSRLAFAVGLSRRANCIIKQNLTFALIVIAVLLAGTLAGNIRLPIGVIGHEGSTLLVVINSLRLLWHK